LERINIAIDGHAGCGKSTTAREVARRLGYLYIDTGAMYRAVTLHFLRNQVPFEEETPEMRKALDDLKIDFVVEGEKREVCLNGERVEGEIRSPEVSASVSQASVHPMVRRELVAQQQRMAKQKGVVMDGRDIGTVVLPEAELKVFMTASTEIRAKRRQQELKEKGVDWSLEKIIENLEQRDRIDASRKEGPLKKAEDAIEIDTSHINISEQVERVLKLAESRRKGLS
jgi:cytidylate kinase